METVMNRVEVISPDGVCLWADCYDLDTKTYLREEMGVVVATRPMTTEEWLREGPQPLGPIGALATLLVVEGVLPIADAANAVGATPQQLIDEAQGWAAAGG